MIYTSLYFALLYWLKFPKCIVLILQFWHSLLLQSWQCWLSHYIIMLHKVNLLFAWASGCNLPNADLQNNLNVRTMCKHSISNANCCDSFSTLVMMFYNSAFVCSHGHWGLESKGYYFNKWYNGDQPHFDLCSLTLKCWPNFCNSYKT